MVGNDLAAASSDAVAECVIALRLYYYSAGAFALRFDVTAADIDNAVSFGTAVVVGEVVVASQASAFDLQNCWKVSLAPYHFLQDFVEPQKCFECSARLNFGQKYLAWKTVISHCRAVMQMIHQSNLVLQKKQYYCECSEVRSADLLEDD